jgi:ribosomal-protein-serine acetyltransferase
MMREHEVRKSFPLQSTLPQGLGLRGLALRDASQLRTILQQNEDIRRFLGYATFASQGEASWFVRSIHAQERANTARWWAIVDHDRLVGAVFFIRLELSPSRWGQRTGTLGYWLDSAYRNKGVTTAAARRVLELGFSQWKLHKVKIGHVQSNAASRAVITKMGFRRVGIERKEFHWHGRWMDHFLYELLAAEWQRQPTAAALSPFNHIAG